MHGKHSWYVEDSSSEDAVIEQTLRDEVVEYIKRKPGVWSYQKNLTPPFL